ncbi:hypothetical protein [Mesorhizobium sp. M3A.F.Ca.ET.201.01.1.1]|uniref:sugar ABC transporter substrate-binding protein n=1 Tax=Mesorhizobium sp. M3A.F.Ca.ET.201.01.1.1 TaxID=2563946 RepID=UPI001FEE59F5|nr:hypothetical protein [Mesorhizobium sp. M3A.F.Ca.ET.201.01.1.1]
MSDEQNAVDLATVTGSEETGMTRRSLLRGLGSMYVGAAALGGLVAGRKTAWAQDVPKAPSTGKKVRVGMPLNYGPFNQPWRRGCAAIARTVEARGGEFVTVRGEPSKQSEQQGQLQLLDQNIDVLILGVLQTESETAFIVDQAQQRGIKTVGFQVTAKNSPAIVEDSFTAGVQMAYLVQNELSRQGAVVQTAEDRGFFAGFDKSVDTVELMTKYEPRMKCLPFMPGSVSTSDQMAKGRENTLSLLQANPDPASVQAIIAWWWPLAVGAAQALRTAPDRDIMLACYYFSDQLLSEMASPGSKIKIAMDSPWRVSGEKVVDLAMLLGRGEKVENIVYYTETETIRPPQAAATREKLLAEDKAAIELLAKYGG